MKEYHPDKQLHNTTTNNNDNDDSEQSITAETITHAYQTLKVPHTRALHWLELHGCPLLEDGPKRSERNDDEPEDDANPQELVGMEFLMEIMEWREAIEDAGSDQPKLEAIAEETRILQTKCETALKDLLVEDDVGVDVDVDVDVDGAIAKKATFSDARQLTAQLQYWHKLETTLKDAID